jgi:MFS family permease
MDVREKNVLVVACAGHFLAHFSMLVFPALVVPIGTDLTTLSFDEILALSFPSYLAFGLTALPAGFLAARFKARHLLALGALLVAVGAFGAGLTGTADNLMLWLLLIGVGAGFYHPVGTALVSNTIRSRGKGHGILGACGNVGIAAAPFTAGAIAFAAGWRSAYEILGVIALGVALLTLWMRVDEGTVEPSARVQKDLDASIRQRVMLFVVLAASMTLAGFVYRGFHVLLPTHLGESLFSAEDLVSGSANFWSTLYTTGALILAAGGQLLGGRLADRFSLVWGLLLFHALSFPMLLGVAFIQGPFLPFFAGWFAFFNLGMQPFENSLVARYIPPRHRSIGYGLKFVFSFGVGSVAVLYAGQRETVAGTAGAMGAFLPFLLGVVVLTALLGILERSVEQGHRE